MACRLFCMSTRVGWHRVTQGLDALSACVYAGDEAAFLWEFERQAIASGDWCAMRFGGAPLIEHAIEHNPYAFVVLLFNNNGSYIQPKSKFDATCFGVDSTPLSLYTLDDPNPLGDIERTNKHNTKHCAAKLGHFFAVAHTATPLDIDRLYTMFWGKACENSYLEVGTHYPSREEFKTMAGQAWAYRTHLREAVAGTSSSRAKHYFSAALILASYATVECVPMFADSVSRYALSTLYKQAVQQYREVPAEARSDIDTKCYALALDHLHRYQTDFALVEAERKLLEKEVSSLTSAELASFELICDLPAPVIPVAPVF